MIVAKRGLLSFEDFLTLVQEDQKADLIDGVMYMASPENTDANELFAWLICLLESFVRKQQLGRVFGSRVAFRLGSGNGPEPDLAILLKENNDRIHRGYVEGPPDLAMEIVSPESVERDYILKREQYERAGVREYWIIDELEEKVLLLRLHADGTFHEVRPRKGILTSRVLPGFWLKLAWLWERPLADPFDVRQEILEAYS